jgi:cytochrome b561
MVPQTEPLRHPLAGLHLGGKMLNVLFACAACVTVLTGLVGSLGASWGGHVLGSRIALLALFGLLLFGSAFARCQWCIKHPPRRLVPADVHALARHLSRTQYLLLYLVVGAREIIGILAGPRHNGSVEFHVWNAQVGHSFGPGGIDANDDLQWILGAGLLALILIRVLMFRMWLRYSQRAALL